MELKPVENSCAVEIDPGVPAIGRIRLWVPEAIVSNIGNCAVYPVGDWSTSADGLRQTIPVENSVGPGNCPRIDETSFECCGIRIPADQRVEWETSVFAEKDRTTFTIRVTNLGDQPVRKATAAICMKFCEAEWWSDEKTFGVRDGTATALSELGMDAGQPNTFQAYLLKGVEYENVFYREYWGINRHRLDRALLVSEHTEAGLCVGIESESAYGMHSNRGNPCTDMLLAFGDIEGHGTAEAAGAMWVRRGLGKDIIG
jgi:hypothetical protein